MNQQKHNGAWQFTYGQYVGIFKSSDDCIAKAGLKGERIYDNADKTKDTE